MNGDSFAHSTNLLVTILYETWELDMNKGWPLFSESPSLVETVALLFVREGKGGCSQGQAKRRASLPNTDLSICISVCLNSLPGWKGQGSSAGL